MAGPCCAPAQDTLGVIDLFGNRKVAAGAVLKAAQLTPGLPIDRQTLNKTTLINRLKALPGVKGATVEIVCCDDKTGKSIAYLGIAESTDQLPVYREAPVKNYSLPDEMLHHYQLYFDRMEAAIRLGNSGQDQVDGYALMQDSATRIVQLKFVDYAQRYAGTLKEAIHSSNNAEHRAIATMIIAYGANKEQLVPELLYATQDSDETVRNNATRALWVLADYLAEHPEIKVTIPATPFIRMMHSVSWTDRNKASLVLLALTQQRNKSLLDTLKKECLPALTEMARWQSQGHAFSTYLILGRIAGIPDQDVFQAFNSENRLPYLQTMLQKINQ